MGLVMDLVAGDSREILLAVAVDDLASFGDRNRFPAHLTLGGAVDPTWLDLFSQAARVVTGGDDPMDFLEARTELEGPAGSGGERTVERVDGGWITAVAMLEDRHLDAITGRWIDLLEEDLGELPREEKPTIRMFARQIVEFARLADRAPAVILAWSL
ncbi:MAG TPA: hypothetical protein VJ689_10345 [Gaiellaceae bacterium]|nr:hypothetical protein [Gaiellaceae bacterium]